MTTTEDWNSEACEPIIGHQPLNCLCSFKDISRTGMESHIGPLRRYGNHGDLQIGLKGVMEEYAFPHTVGRCNFTRPLFYFLAWFVYQRFSNERLNVWDFPLEVALHESAESTVGIVNTIVVKELIGR